jgi:hypothetical protein
MELLPYICGVESNEAETQNYQAMNTITLELTAPTFNMGKPTGRTVADEISAGHSAFSVEGRSQFHKAVVGKSYYPIDGDDRHVWYCEQIVFVNNDRERSQCVEAPPKKVRTTYLDPAVIRQINNHGRAQAFAEVGRYMSHRYDLK